MRSLLVRARRVGQLRSAADGSAQGIDEHTLLLTVLADDAASAARELAGLRGCGPAVIIAWGLDYQAVREPRGIQRPADSLSP